MARGVNKVIIVGNLGNDPEVRYTAGGVAITTMNVATSESWKDKESGEKQERTEWHRIKFFGRLAEIAGEYLRKGSQVYVEGSLRTDKYTDKDGIERYATNIIGNEMQMLGSRGGEGGGGGSRSDAERYAGRSERAAERAAPSGRGGSQSGGAPSTRGGGGAVPPPDDFTDDDSIPF